MTEGDWLRGAPRAMVAALRGLGLPRSTDLRKRRLLACACGRRVEHLLADVRLLQAIEASERFAEGRLDVVGLEAAYDEARRAVQEGGRDVGQARWLTPEGHRRAWNAYGQRVVYQQLPWIIAHFAGTLARLMASELPWEVLLEAAYGAEFLAGPHEASSRDVSPAVVGLLRDLYGNPFRPVEVEPGWLTWSAGTPRRLAEVIASERRYADLPILADALEEAGCDEPALLEHCRRPGRHVPGCWALDLLLGRG